MGTHGTWDATAAEQEWAKDGSFEYEEQAEEAEEQASGDDPEPMPEDKPPEPVPSFISASICSTCRCSSRGG